MIDRIVVISLLVLICISGCVSSGVSKSDVKSFIESDLTEWVDDGGETIQKETSLYTYVGVGLFVLGALTFAFATKSSGIYLMIAGGGAGSSPYIVTSDYFDYIVGGTLLSLALIGIHFVYWKVKKAEQPDVSNPPR